MIGRTTIFGLISACLILFLWAPRVCRADAPREYQLKAAFIYNFMQFVEWPASAFPDGRAPIVLATIGDDPFQGALDHAVSGKHVNGRPIVVKHFTRAADVQGCHLIFFADGQDEQFNAVTQKLGNAPVLTVGDSDAFTREGGIIRFYEEDNRLRFEVNPKAATRAGLRISSKLLKLARITNG